MRCDVPSRAYDELNQARHDLKPTVQISIMRYDIVAVPKLTSKKESQAQETSWRQNAAGWQCNTLRIQKSENLFHPFDILRVFLVVNFIPFSDCFVGPFVDGVWMID